MTGSFSDDIRYGFIGVGMMGQEHLRNVDALPGASPVAVADPDPGSLRRAVDSIPGAVTAYSDATEMLVRESLDAVVISSPNHTHRAALEDLWGSHLHVMIEKPMCTTIEDCLAVRDAATAHQGLVWVGLEYRYMPPVQRFLTELSAGTAGEVRMVSIREHRYPFLDKVDHWNRFSANTGGTLVEKCCHFFDLMRLTMPGRPVRVMASGAQDVNHLQERYPEGTPDILDNAFVIVDFDHGGRALLDLSMFAEGSAFEQELVAVGAEGKIQVRIPGFMEVARGRPAELMVGSRGPDWPVSVTDLGADERVRYTGAHHGASYLEHVDFCAAIRGGTTALVNVDDGLWSVALGVAAHRSIEEGRIVTMDELDLPGDLS